ncbi:hypothetical protein AN639_03035 [Candidatus Epulonipiscium fishelsonii]|uniref:Uncharacterized protein n=1 Tax=Candidatus Epulonipiscium fishelsonii TaxID=77094 RepID=A0ACC8X9R8_9FIRM|nr:hypothetical protein AN396_01435 [Epulopiscium sp. SCG-B11WGA-EpuloA1]ONI41717.1 hypothetical protein AN639_03035 [Epulopiscium sp. SCG-B05WGA-EpuloA1]
MNITMNNTVDQYNNFNVIGVDKVKKEEAPKNTIDFNQDSVFLSKAGKAMSQIDKLNKQKENLQERREELLEKSLAGEDVSDEIEKLDEEMLEIEKEISSAKQKEMEKNTKDSSEKTIKAEPKIKEEAMSQKMNSIISSSVGLNQIEITYSAQSRLESNARVLRAEANTYHGEMKSAKLKEAAELETLALSLSKKVSKQVENVEEELVDVKEIPKKVEEPHKDKEHKENKEHITIDIAL